ncbi:hypothetical protein AALB51_12560 [Lachnospiraceae bacterium 62-26]
MCWFQKMNSIRSRAEEVVMRTKFPHCIKNVNP